MNDRFKFRGMTLGGEWVYGNIAIINEKIKSCGMPIDAGFYISNKVGMPFAYPVRPETLGQCTGLKDKNSKLIYEGDIVQMSYPYYPQNKYLVKWGDCCWELWLKNGFVYIIYEKMSLSMEVIGNEHENKDLLGKE